VNTEKLLTEVASTKVGYSGYWTTPGETERQAFLAAETIGWPEGDFYFGFPWFSLFHALETNNAQLSSRLLILLDQLVKQIPHKARVVSVSQHPGSLNFVEYFRRARISVLFDAHKPRELRETLDIKLLPFPLIPLQVPVDIAPPTAQSERKYLASFIGTRGSGDHYSAIREYIFMLKKRTDLRIIERPAWYYAQIIERDLELNSAVTDEMRIEEFEFAKQFRNAMRDSKFALCPIGRGLCTTRIYEALSSGTVPIILTTELDLPGDESLWHSAAVFSADSKEGVDRALSIVQGLSSAHVEEMKRQGVKLLHSLASFRFGQVIQNSIRELDALSNT